MKRKALAVACALAAGLCGLSTFAETSDSSDASRALALRKFQFEQMLAFQRARGDKVVPNSPYDPMPLLKPLDAKTQFERMGGKLVPAPPSNDQLLEQAIAKTYLKMLTGGGCCPCVAAASCNNGFFCDGAEVCTSGNCELGPAACNDGNPCTNDSCTENTDTCSFTPVPPPAAVATLGVRRSAPGSNVSTMTWSAVAGATSYNVYRGTASNLGNLACFLPGLTGTTQNDDGAIPTSAFYLLVTSKACSESSLGSGNPSPRPAPPGCP